MKKMIAVAAVLALASVPVQTAKAGDREWATAGKILTGVAIGAVVASAANAHASYSVTYYSAPVYCPPPAPVVFAAPVVCAPPRIVVAPAPVVYVPRPVVIHRPPVVVAPPVIHVRPDPHYRRGHHHDRYDRRGHRGHR